MKKPTTKVKRVPRLEAVLEQMGACHMAKLFCSGLTLQQAWTKLNKQNKNKDEGWKRRIRDWKMFLIRHCGLTSLCNFPKVNCACFYCQNAMDRRREYGVSLTARMRKYLWTPRECPQELLDAFGGYEKPAQKAKRS